MNGAMALLGKLDFTARAKGGYDKQEVDDFLETINENYTKLQTAYETLSRQYAQQSGELQQARNDLESQCAYYEWQIGALNNWTASQMTPYPIERGMYQQEFWG